MAPKAFSAKQDFLDSLVLPDSEVIQAFVYFSPELWPKISKLIQDHLQSKGVSCSVAHMVENDKRGFYNPWIIIRVIPTSKETITKDIEKWIKELMIENSLNNPIYRIHIESGKRAPRPPTIDTEMKSNNFRSYSADRVYTAPEKDTIHTPEVLSVSTNLPNLLFDKSLFDKAFEAATGKAMEKNDLSRSVKHLTCWYWSNHPNGCIKSAENCSYAHVDTGRYAERPRSVFPGGPRLAGRNANRIEATLREGLAMHLGMDVPANAAAALDAEKSKETADSTTSANENAGSRIAPSFSIGRDRVAVPISGYQSRTMASARPFGSFTRGKKGAFVLETFHDQARTATNKDFASPGSNTVSDNNNSVPVNSPGTTGLNSNIGTPTKSKRSRGRDKKMKAKHESSKKMGNYHEQLVTTNWACRELCIGLDLGVKQLKDVMNKASALHNSLISLNSTLDTEVDINTARTVKVNLDSLITDTQVTVDLMGVYRDRAENYLTIENNAGNAFRWWDNVDRLHDAESTVAAAHEFITAATAGGSTVHEDGFEDEGEGGVGLGVGLEVGNTELDHDAGLAVEPADGITTTVGGFGTSADGTVVLPAIFAATSLRSGETKDADNGEA